MTILSNLSWITEKNLSDMMLILGRYSSQFQNKIDVLLTDPVQRALAGLEDASPSITLSLQNDMRVMRAFIENGGIPSVEQLHNLEQRAENNFLFLTDVRRWQVLFLPEKEIEIRQKLAQAELPFVLPGELTALHVDLFAVGDRVLHVLHVDGLNQLAKFAIEALEVDVQHQKMWLLPFLEVLPEKILLRTIRKLENKKKFQNGGIGLLAFYAFRMGKDPQKILEKGTKLDQLFFDLAKLKIQEK